MTKIMVMIVVNIIMIMPMTNLYQWFLFCRGLPAPETWCPLLPGGLTMVIIILVIKDHADSDHDDYDRGEPPLNHPHHQHHHQKITIISINIANSVFHKK